MEERNLPWLHSWWFDILFFIGPAFFSVFFIWIFELAAAAQISPLQWFIVIVFVDVAHVHSTLYRTYFDADERAKRGTLLFCIPVFTWLAGAIIYTLGAQYFWTVVAYLAVFHFVRQQYGFMLLYGRFERAEGKVFDRLAIYAVTLYPMIYWHSHLPRAFEWMIEGDFIVGIPQSVEIVARVIFVVIALLYFFKEVQSWIQLREINYPKNLWLIGTALVWFSGIIIYNSDVVFTFSNVLSHGIPYLALIWLYGARKWMASDKVKIKFSIAQVFRLKFLPIFLGFLFLVAYLEESFWDAYVWKEYAQFFSWLKSVPMITDPVTLGWFVPLLAVPQLTHYILDGFIWRIRNDDLAPLDLAPIDLSRS